jgi:hypothetical protein
LRVPALLRPRAKLAATIFGIPKKPRLAARGAQLSI